MEGVAGQTDRRPHQIVLSIGHDWVLKFALMLVELFDRLYELAAYIGNFLVKSLRCSLSACKLGGRLGLALFETFDSGNLLLVVNRIVKKRLRHFN